MEEIVYLNGELIPASQACISVSDHGFLYGYGLFETMRAYHGKIFLLERHIQRLRDAAEAIGLGSQLTGIDLGEACSETLRANGLEDARLRLTVSHGESDGLPWSDDSGKPTVIITARPHAPFPEEKYREGFKVRIVSLRRSQSLISGIKTTSYLVSVLARREAAADGRDEGLLLNDDGYIAEGGGSNVFFVRSSRLVTPSLGSGILPGVTREVVIELAGGLGMVATEGTVGLAIIRQCDEAFLTNSVMEIMPVVSVSDGTGQTVTIGPGRPGEVTKRLMAAYKEMVAREIGP